MKYSDEQRIAKIVETTDKLIKYISDKSLTREMVLEDETIRWTITTPLYNIGEHAYNLSDEFKQIQAGIAVKTALDRPVENGDEHFACRADDRAVEVSSDHGAVRSAGAHVQMRVILALHPRDVADERYDLPVAGKAPGVVLFLRRVEHADGEIPHRAERADMSKADILRKSDLFQLLEDLFPTVDPRGDRIVKAGVLHPQSSFSALSLSVVAIHVAGAVEQVVQVVDVVDVAFG